MNSVGSDSNSSVSTLLQKIATYQTPEVKDAPKYTRVDFLLSRDKLLQHLETSKKDLTQRIKKFHQSDEKMQNIFLKKYVEFQADLDHLKKLLKKLLERENASSPAGDDDKELLNITKLTLNEEFRNIVRRFQNYLRVSGFI